MPTPKQIQLVEQIKTLCAELSIESEDFPESARKYIAVLSLHSGWLVSELIYTGDIKFKGRPPLRGELTSEPKCDIIQESSKKRGRPKK